MLTEERLGSRTHAESVLELFASAMSYPSNLRSEALDMILFLLEETLGDKHRHTNILVASSLEHSIEDALDIFPDSIAIGSDDHTALNASIFDKLSFFANIGIPLCKVLVHRGNSGNHLFFFSHYDEPLFCIYTFIITQFPILVKQKLRINE